MTCEVLNSHQFSVLVNSFQDQAIASATQKAEQLAADKEAFLKVNVVSRAICKEAYNTFKNKIEQAFPSPIYHDAITLILQARETLFFVDLKEHVITLLSKYQS